MLWHLLPQARFLLQQYVLQQNCGVLLVVQMQSVVGEKEGVCIIVVENEGVCIIVGENEGVCIIRWHYPDIPRQPASPF